MKQLLVYGDKTFKITVPDDAKMTFGPWSPPPKGREWSQGEKVGTLRVYQNTKENILACFGGVTGFRDLSLSYAEEVVKEEGATIWKDDEHGYVREHRQSVKHKWVNPARVLKEGDVEILKPKKRKRPSRSKKDVNI